MAVWAIFAGLAGVIHIAFFVLESFVFTKPAGRKIFGTSEADAETMKFFAFNQGFYNLFLAIGTFAGIALGHRVLVIFTCASMVGAAAILATGGKKLIRGVIMQGAPPLIALIMMHVS